MRKPLAFLRRNWCEHIKWYRHPSGIEGFRLYSEITKGAKASGIFGEYVNVDVNFCPICGTKHPEHSNVRFNFEP